MEGINSLSEIQNFRDKEIIKVSFINIFINVLLSIFKWVIGVLSNSIAIKADAINSLSDGLAALVTIIGIKLSRKEPNKKHPLGYGRYEYFSDGIVSFLVLYVGITLFFDSFKKIFEPEQVEYTQITIIVLIIAIIIKVFLGIHERKIGKKHNSKALIASGVDSLTDSIVTLSVLLTTIIDIIFKINLEVYLGIIISILVIKSGYKMFKETIDEIIGQRVKGEILNNIKDSIIKEPEVFGAFDLILHSYGYGKYIGSVHIEVESTLTMKELDLLERRITAKILKKYGVLLTGIGIYSIDVENQEIIDLRNTITNICKSFEYVLQLHGFIANLDEKYIRFDIIIDFENSDKNIIENIKKEIKRVYPDYKIDIQKDLDIDL